MGKQFESLVAMHDERSRTSEERKVRHAAELQQLSDEELRDVMDKGDAATAEFNRRALFTEKIIENRIKAIHQGVRAAAIFTPDDLTYAAGARCSCGAGMAYPDAIGPQGAWHCSAILTGAAPHGSQHDRSAPFSLVEIRSEYQHGGGTTRPAKETR